MPPSPDPDLLRGDHPAAVPFTPAQPTTHSSGDLRRTATVEIVIPVFDEEAGLEASVLRLHRYLTERFPLSWTITIVDNASTDRTWGIACRMAGALDQVQAIHLDRKGRGRALRTAWMASDAVVVTYMDVDLSTDLDALLPLVAPLVSGHSDLAIGTRLAPASRVVRGAKREAVSRSYNLLLKLALHSGFSDAQCGFKAVRADVARALLPLVEDDGWFFDTELLVLAEQQGLRIHEVPVDWVDDPDSRVDVVSTAKGDLRGIWRMLRTGSDRPVPALATAPWAGERAGRDDLAGQLVRFASIGLVSTIVFALLFVLLVGPLGALPANLVALATCAVANTAANRRLTFSLRGRVGRRRQWLAGLVVAALPLVLTVATLIGLGAIGVTSVVAQVVALTAVNGAASLARFVLLRRWVFRHEAGSTSMPRPLRAP